MHAAAVIIEASSEAQFAAAKTLMIEYRDQALAEDYGIGGGGLNGELAVFPGPYARPNGLLLLAVLDGQPCGCLALRKISNNHGEVMRMYVQPHARGKGLAEKLMRTLIAKASTMGYKALFLDSMKRFTAAHKLYEKLGFIYCDPYSINTTDAMKTHMIFMRLGLNPSDNTA